MSMIGCYRRVTSNELLELQSNSSCIAEFLYPEEEEQARAEWITNPTDNEPPPESQVFDVDKAWQAIHFLLCGDVIEGRPPLGNAVLGGTPLGDVDLGYGPARYLTPGEVRAVADALDAIPVDELMERFDHAAMLEAGAIFANTDASEAEERDYIEFHYPALRRYFLEAAKAGDAMLLWIF